MLTLIKSIKSEAAVGFLILASSGLLVYSSLKVTGWKSEHAETYIVSSILDNVTGLSIGTAVRMAGIKIGEVTDIALEGGQARVSMTIYQKYPLRKNSQISVKSLGILGDKYIEVTAGESVYGTLEDGDEIILVQKGSDLDSMLESLSGILRDFKDVTYAFRESMGGDTGAAKFNSILYNLDSFLQKLNAISTENQQGIKSLVDNLGAFSADLKEITERNKAELKEIVTNIEAITASLRGDLPEITGNIRELLYDNKDRLDRIIINLETASAALDKDLPEITSSLRSTFRQLDDSAGKLDDSVANVASITEKMDDGQGTLGRLINDEETIDKLNKALDDLGGFLGDANKLKFDLDFRTEYMNRYEAYKSYLGLELFPYRDHSFLINLVDDPNGKSKTKTEETITTNNDGSTTKKNEKTTTYTDDFKFSLLITQRYFDTRFRAGLIENTFGFGVDQYFGINDQFKAYAEAYDFNNKNDNVHYKIGGSWRFLGGFYVTAGADHLASRYDADRNYFLGIGLGFNEDSLKTLATAAGGAAALSK